MRLWGSVLEDLGALTLWTWAFLAGLIVLIAGMEAVVPRVGDLLSHSIGAR